MKISRHLVPLLEALLGVTLLVKELYQWSVLPGMYDKTYEFVDFAKYKENTYSFIFLWSVLLIIGLIGLINNVSKWLANQILIFAVTIGLMIGVIFNGVVKSPEVIIWGILLSAALFVAYKFHKSKLTEAVKPTQKYIVISLVVGFIIAITFWTIEITCVNISLFESF